jgi:hypothetical protein
MNATSNIFVYIELSKFVEKLSMEEQDSRRFLKAQAGYFNVIPTKYFSDALCPEWESITAFIKKEGPQYDAQGRLVANAYVNTINQLSAGECTEVARRIVALSEKVRKEFENA